MNSPTPNTDSLEAVAVFRQMMADALAKTALADAPLADADSLTHALASTTTPNTAPQHSSASDTIISMVTSSLKASDSIRALVQSLNWYQIFDAESLAQLSETLMPEAFGSETLLAAQVIGPNGLARSEAMIGGLFWLAPNIHYPLHQHPALEAYLCLDGAVVIRHGIDAPPIHLNQAGQLSITPPWQLHSLTTGDAPCLLAYLWTGDLTAENRWWVEDGEFLCWIRQSDGRWGIDRDKKLADSLRPSPQKY